MGNVRRVYVEKKSEFAVRARELGHELRHYLGLGVEDVRIFIRYDAENVSQEAFSEALQTVFSEPPVDSVYLEEFPIEIKSGFNNSQDAGPYVFSVEYLPGQFDQRADSAEQCIRLIDVGAGADPIVRSATVYAVYGKLSEADRDAIKNYCINPVDSREAGMEKPESLKQDFAAPADVAVMDGFCAMGEDEIRKCYDALNLAMTLADLTHIQNYFKNEEKRDPTITEIRVLDTYWSDHCRHTTFSTELTRVEFSDGPYREPIEASFRDYMRTRERLFGEAGYAQSGDGAYEAAEASAEKAKKHPVCLMDLALVAMRRLKAEGKLQDQEESEENNACSIVVPVEIDGVTEEWLVNFKNETHNHPTEIEPFGGAATCLGGAIRDPLSGRTYVYQAMRVTGAADPTRPASETLPGKLPQKKIVREAAKGYSSYGNQIGLATGYVKEIYHPNYAAKRLEIGAVIGAAPRRAVKRISPVPGDKVILLGGRTGRDGIGGATGSSKAHNAQSTSECGAEVQKGNAPTERKIQRLFRREEVSSIIKKCNDFGAGGVAVAIGELADGLTVDLDAVPKKYAGLDGTELAISESQERMAVVVAPEDVDKFLRYADEENLEAVETAVITEQKRLVLTWRGREIVNISRAFLDTNGARQEAEVVVSGGVPGAAPSKRAAAGTGCAGSPAVDALCASAAPGELAQARFFAHPEIPAVASAADTASALRAVVSDINVCSQRGLVEMFDSSIGAGTVVMPYGGKYQKTETQGMIAKLPIYEEKRAKAGENEHCSDCGATPQCSAVTMMACGFDPYLSSWSPYHGAAYAVLESVSRIAAMGGDTGKVRLTFQEYFRRMGDAEHPDPEGWGLPLSSLLGAYQAQIGLGLPSIGGKDSMSGSYSYTDENGRERRIDVPPTLVSFAVAVGDEKTVVMPELKNAGDSLVIFNIKRDKYDLPDWGQAMKMYGVIFDCAKAGLVESSYALDGKGLAPALMKMAFGGDLGVRVGADVSDGTLFCPGFGSIVAEVKPESAAAIKEKFAAAGLSDCVKAVGQVDDSGMFTIETSMVDDQNKAKVLNNAETLSDAAADEVAISIDELRKLWEAPLESVYPTRPADYEATEAAVPVGTDEKRVFICKNKVARPKVFIPVMPGTNCEYDCGRAFTEAGAEVSVRVFKNLDAGAIRSSVDEYVREIRQAQIIMFPGGFSAGDEPEGSAKFFAAVFRNEKIAEEVMRLLRERDGLILGICNGFQALMKLGLLPYGEIRRQDGDSPTLTYNMVGRHVSRMVSTKVMSTASPWLSGVSAGDIYSTPASHGEGRFVATPEWLKRLYAGGQVATAYVDASGRPTMDPDYNPNGSQLSIEGILSPDGHILGKMAHCERSTASTASNIPARQNMHLFKSGVEYFK